MDQHDSGEAWDGPLPVFNNRGANLVLNDIDLTEQSSLATLRNAAEYLGIGTGDSKKTLWHRLNQQVQKIEHQQLFASANRLYKEQNKHKGLVHVPLPRQPSQQERELHELVHLPYQPWCDVCVSCKSRADAQRPLDLSEEERRTSPSIQLDYGFGRSEGKTSSQTALTVVLVGVDCESRMLMAMPVESKGADLRGQAEQVTKFSLAMSHYSKLEIVVDSEPTMKSLLTLIKTLRQGLGLETVLTFSQKKGQTGRVERAIHTFRRQASALVKIIVCPARTRTRTRTRTETVIQIDELNLERIYMEGTELELELDLELDLELELELLEVNPVDE